ncbi:aminoglycoside phosphotransferase family protein [Frankia sp. Cas4]|uniref:phosphotransferase family protein n=1 Tax=Frankia sp. Cas4 TaxID=3073927 RepID=UPI002AD4DAB7|nr:aminoglycoside phosphotransferase family protein [Frankia sp. Cas4]
MAVTGCDGRFTVANAWSILREMCAAVGLDDRDAEVIKITANAVFRLPRARLVIRICGSQAMAHRAHKVVQVARWLARHEVPAVRLAPGLPAPLLLGSVVATLWIDAQAEPRLVEPPGRHFQENQPLLGVRGPTTHAATTRGSTALGASALGSTAHVSASRASTTGERVVNGDPPAASDLAVVLQRIHALPQPDTALPPWDPLDDVRRRLADAEGLTDADLAFLRRMADRLQAALEGVTYDLPAGIVHGDAHLGNLIRCHDGRVVMCDFDSACYGPTEWDLIPVAVGQLRFGYPPEQHAVLASEYGFDVTRWSGFEVLRALRELKLVTSVVPILASNPRVAAQFAVRLASLRYADESVRWLPYS